MGMGTNFKSANPRARRGAERRRRGEEGMDRSGIERSGSGRWRIPPSIILAVCSIIHAQLENAAAISISVFVSPALTSISSLHPFLHLWNVSIRSDHVNVTILSCDGWCEILLPPGLVHAPIDTDDIQT